MKPIQKQYKPCGKKQPTHSNAVILLKRQMTVIIVLNIDFPDPGFFIPDS